MDDKLLDLYYEAALEGTTLQEFFDQIVAGVYGHWDRPIILGCLDRIEQIVLGNIVTMQESRPRIATDGEEDDLAEAEAEFNRVRTRLLRT